MVVTARMLNWSTACSNIPLYSLNTENIYVEFATNLLGLPDNPEELVNGEPSADLSTNSTRKFDHDKPRQGNLGINIIDDQTTVLAYAYQEYPIYPSFRIVKHDPHLYWQAAFARSQRYPAESKGSRILLRYLAS